MARTGTKRAPKPKAQKYADIDDGVLDTDSEADEFETYGQRDAGSDDEDEVFGSAEEEEGDGVGQWEPDDWNGEDDMSSESDEESASDSEVAMRKLKKGLNDIPLATLMKAQAAMRGAPVAADRDGEPGPTTERERKLAAAKARLAEMARAKGKGKAIEDSSRGRAGSSDGSDSEDGNGKRSNKHA